MPKKTDAKNASTPDAPETVLRRPAELLYGDQLEALRQNDPDPAPGPWVLSLRSVPLYITGGKTLPLKKGRKKEEVEIIFKQLMGDIGHPINDEQNTELSYFFTQ